MNGLCVDQPCWVSDRQTELEPTAVVGEGQGWGTQGKVFGFGGFQRARVTTSLIMPGELSMTEPLLLVEKKICGVSHLNQDTI